MKKARGTCGFTVMTYEPATSENQGIGAGVNANSVLQAIAFAVWNGENQERNGQKAVAPWFQLAIDTVEKS